MKNHIIVLVLLFAITGFGQTVVPSGSPNQVTDFKGGIKVAKTLNLPVTDADPFPGQDKLGQVRISPTDSIVRYFNGVEWKEIVSEDNDYVTDAEFEAAIEAQEQSTIDGDNLRVPYIGATQDIDIGSNTLKGDEWQLTNYNLTIGAPYQQTSYRHGSITSDFSNEVSGVYHYYLPKCSGYIPMVINGQIADIYGNINIGTGESSQLEKITEEGNTGWRLYGVNPEYYGNIGVNAVDLSYSDTSGEYGAVGYHSFTAGYKTKASYQATALGSETQATGLYSFAEGRQTIASGLAAHAEGLNTSASAFHAHAEGTSTTASQQAAHSEGIGTIASGPASHAGGFYNTASSYGEIAIGAFATNYTATSTMSFNTNDRIFTIGIGTSSSNRADAIRGWKDGTFELPSATNANITARGNKAIPTVEYLNSRYLPLTGGAMTGNLTAPTPNSFRVAAIPNNVGFFNDNTRITDIPIASEIWHDMLAFNRAWGAATFETSGDGAVWNTETVNNNLFSQRENLNISYNATTQKHIRWTWTGVDYCFARWLKINWAFSAGTYSKNVIVETSANGTTWTTRHNSASTTNGSPEFFFMTDWFSDTYVRLTIINNGTANIALAGIKILTARAGDQGRGRELQFPYDWDADRNIILPGYIKSNTYRSNGSGISFAGTSGTAWGGFNESTGRLTLNNAPTSGSNEAVREIDLQYTKPSFAVVTAAYTTGTARTIAANGTFTVTLATTGVPDGMEYYIENTGSGTITVQVSGGGTIEGASSKAIATQWTGLTFIKTGANYIVKN